MKANIQITRSRSDVSPATLTAIVLISFFLTSACGSKNEGEGIAIAVQPNNEVLLGPGPVSSCRDRFAAKLAGVIPGRSVTGPVMLFNNFQIQWSTSETFYIQGFKWKVEGAGIKDGKHEASLDPAEIEALVGLVGATQNGAMSTAINSNDSNRTYFAPCGLALGGVTLANDKDQTPFKARVTLEVIGTAQDSSGNQRFVRTRVVTRARFEGI